MCLTPTVVKPKPGTLSNDGYSHHTVPCGRCAKCRLRRIQGWVFRLQQEYKRHYSAHFLTLTYENPPITTRGYMSLRRKDLTNFFKRLRARTRCKTIRYYACGEYGSAGDRPHYHVILFDARPEDIMACWSPDTVSECSDRGAVVQLGYVHFGPVNDATIAYTAKYMAKLSRIPIHANDDRIPEYSVMSKGIGLNYLSDPANVAYHRNDMKSYILTDTGYFNALPRYYRDRLFSESERATMGAQLSDKFDAAFSAGVRDYDDDVYAYYRALHYSARAQNKEFYANSISKRNKF